MLEELQLAFAEEARRRNVDRFRIVVRVSDVVRTRTLLRDQAARTRLELAVFDDGEADASPVPVGVVHADAALDRRRVERIREVTRLGALDFLDVFDGHEVAAVVTRAGVRLLAALAPDVGLADVVIVGDRDRRTVLDHVTEVASELEPRRVVLAVVVDLIAGRRRAHRHRSFGRSARCRLGRCPRRERGGSSCR